MKKMSINHLIFQNVYNSLIKELQTSQNILEQNTQKDKNQDNVITVQKQSRIFYWNSYFPKDKPLIAKNRIHRTDQEKFYSIDTWVCHKNNSDIIKFQYYDAIIPTLKQNKQQYFQVPAGKIKSLMSSGQLIEKTDKKTKEIYFLISLKQIKDNATNIPQLKANIQSKGRKYE